MEFEEFASLQLDPPLVKDTRTEEQLRKHTLDSNLEQKPIDRALHLLTKGDDIQKLSVIQTLPSLLARDAQSCISRVIPKMQQTLPTASTEFHMAASSTFKSILEQKLVSHGTFTQTFLQSILNSLDSRDPVVAHAWLETLLDVIELLPTDIIRQEILPLAINKGQLSQPISSRITCCKLLGKICTRFDTTSIKSEVLPTVHSLCQDVNSDVRACICLQLRFVAEGLDVDSVKPALLPFLVELARDEESTVRHASVQTIVHLLPQFQQETIKGIIAPLIKKLCESALKSDDNVICIIAQEFGKLALDLESCLTPAEKVWLVKYFQQLAQMGIPSMKKENTKQDFPFISNNPLVNERYVECRRQCAFNIPAMYLFISTATEDINVLLPTFNDLVGDPYYMVRRTVACGIHEVAKVLGAQNGLIKGKLIKLLKDNSEEVLQGLVPHLARTLELLTQSQTIGTDHTDSTVTELGKALLKCEAEIASTNNWRLSALMLEQLESLPKCFPNDFIYSHFVPMALNRALKARPIPVRLSAGKALLVYLRYNLKTMQRTELRNKIYTDFARSQNCYVRMLFIRMMIEAMVIFSSVYFKEHFYTNVLSLTEDSVANVRLKVVTMLPVLKTILRLPADKKLLSALEMSVRNLMNNEKDRDVISTLTSVIRKLDGIDVRHEGQPNSTKLSKQDNEDMKKYEEEKRLAGMIPGKSTGNPTVVYQASGNQGKKQTNSSKYTGHGKVSAGEVYNLKGSRQNSPLPIETLPKPSAQLQLAKGRQPAVSIGISDSETKQPPIKHNSTISKQMTDLTKASTSSNNLTSNWTRLTSNSMLLTHPWERIGHPNSNISLSSVNLSDNNYTSQKSHCDCSELTEHDYQTRFTPSNSSEQEYKINVPCCSCLNADADLSKANNSVPQKYDHYPNSDVAKSFLLTRLKDDNHEFLQNFLLTRENFGSKDKAPDLAALRALTNAAHYNSCWAFSSMPEIPVTLLDDEFLVDAGIRIPAQLSSSQSTSKTPNLQDIIYRNRREGSIDRSRRNSVNYEKGKGKRHSVEFEDGTKQRTTGVDQAKSNRNSIDYEGELRSSQSAKSKLEDYEFVKDDTKAKRYSGPYGRTRFGFEPNQGKSEDKPKRNSLILDKDKSKVSQSKSIVDRAKRHSASYGTKLADTKDSKQKFKRHSVEVTDYVPIERNNRALRRYSTLDVNHNQGSSKIPLRNCPVSGSRTAPVTRASSPIRSGSRLFYNRDSREDIHGQCSPRERFLTRFSSSDEEVNKLCQKILHCQTAPCSRAGSPKGRDSKLPIRSQKKKL